MSLRLGLARNLGVTRSSAAPGQSGALLQTECCLAVTTTPATRYSPATQCFWALPGHPPAQISTVFLACPRSKRAELCCRSSRQLLRSFQRADGFPDPWPVSSPHILLLPAATCGLPTPFSTSFPAHRSRSVLGEVALVLFGVVVGARALSSLAWRLSWYGLNENAQPFQGYLWYNCTSPDLVTVVPDTPWVAWEGRVGRCGLPVLERTR